MSKKFLSVVIAVVMVVSMMIPMMSASADVTGVAVPVAEESAWGVFDPSTGVYVAPDGGFKITTPTTFGEFAADTVPFVFLPATPNMSPFLYLAVYDKNSGSVDSDEVWQNKTADSFASVLSETVNEFEQIIVHGEYQDNIMYCARTDSFDCYVLQANGNKYFMNYFIMKDTAGNIFGYDTREAIDTEIANIMSTIVVAQPIQDEPEPEPAVKSYTFHNVYMELPEGFGDPVEGETVVSENENGDSISWVYDSEADTVDNYDQETLDAALGLIYGDTMSDSSFSKMVVPGPNDTEYDAFIYNFKVTTTDDEGNTTVSDMMLVTVFLGEDGTVDITFVSGERSGDFDNCLETIKVVAPDAEPAPSIPDTGDNSAIVFYGVIALAALAFIVVVATRKNAKER